ncbi:hypothetical protein SAMN05421819_3566 [Bryocella elongata]|uniref:Uncharacterized protein n=1 Tax=Bryocella elongata TaxID=863522 RepID=A0A1H6B8C6_9BACT|nr:hypothetical protein [Bryocella elongata]SEG56376.1 hypothetical protein SAMN05421819_3566 [Bryocella elongata]
MNAQFGSGVVTVTPVAGNLPANPTPTRLKVMQDAQVDFKGDLKSLFGNKMYAVLIAKGKVQVTGKIKIASFSAADINQIYFATAQTSGGNLPVMDEIHAIGATITPTVGAGLTVVEDLGVINNDTGDQMVKVASAPAVGQYTFTPAVTGGSPTAASYGFNASETASHVALNYTATTTGGSSLALTQQQIGYTVITKLMLFNSTKSSFVALELNNVAFGSWSLPTKQDDFWVADVDFTACADASGTLGTLYAN